MTTSDTIYGLFAPVVKWISQRSSEPSFGVRIPAGAQNTQKQDACLVFDLYFVVHAGIRKKRSIFFWLFESVRKIRAAGSRYSDKQSESYAVTESLSSLRPADRDESWRHPIQRDQSHKCTRTIKNTPWCLLLFDWFYFVKEFCFYFSVWFF